MTRTPFEDSIDSRRLLKWHLTMISQTTFDLGPANISPEINFTYPSSSTRYLMQVQHYVSQVALPVIFAFGVLGNTANLMILTSRRLYPHRRQASHMERSAIVGLKSLAVSDLLYCLFGFPNRFLVSDRTSPVAIAVTYYMGYKPALINTFLFSSTWLIVLVCVERYIAVCHPFRAVSVIRVGRTVAAHVFVFFAAVLLNIPLFLNALNKVLKDSCRNHSDVNGSTCYFYVMSPYYLSQGIDGHIHHPIWFTFGTFVPLAIIFFSNALLVTEVCRKSQAAQKGGSYAGRDVRGDRGARSMSSDKGSTMRLTLTLLSIVVCFLVLVVPSMFLQIVSYIERGGSESIRWAVVITNLTQAIKFSSNFILYNIINSTFRQTVARLFKGEGCRNLSSSLHQKKKESLCATPLHCAHLKQQQQQQQLQQPGQLELQQTQQPEEQQQHRQQAPKQEDQETTETTLRATTTTVTNAETVS